MFIIMMSNMMLAITMSLLLSMNPLLMGMSILLLAMSISIMYASMLSSWYAFLLFLIYIGGMLVMFAYFMALIPNQSLKLMYAPIMTMFATAMLYSMSTYINLSPPMYQFNNNQIMDLYTPQNSYILILLALLLLLTMIIVVKISSSSKGPLRAFMS